MSEHSPAAAVVPIIMGLMTSSAVSALARLGVADHLESGPKTADELPAAVQARPELLQRLMRATEGMGILARTPDGRWMQTPMSDVLRTNSPTSLRYLASFMADEWHARAFASVDETIRTGELAMDRVCGMPAFEFFRQNPAAGENFDRAMTGFSAIESPVIQLVEGDMFESIPPGADAYIMKRIIHDWSDERCGRILSGCRAGVRDGGRLLVVDAIVPNHNAFSPARVNRRRTSPAAVDSGSACRGAAAKHRRSRLRRCVPVRGSSLRRRGRLCRSHPPDRVEYDRVAERYELRYASSWNIPGAETVLSIRRADLNEASGRGRGRSHDLELAVRRHTPASNPGGRDGN